MIAFFPFYNICMPASDRPVMKAMIIIQSHTLFPLCSRLSLAIIIPNFQVDIVMILDLKHEELTFFI